MACCQAKVFQPARLIGLGQRTPVMHKQRLRLGAGVGEQLGQSDAKNVGGGLVAPEGNGGRSDLHPVHRRLVNPKDFGKVGLRRKAPEGADTGQVHMRMMHN